jgi:exopolysaccharide biosynthesis polyprenyl glycosylphosphotransferase
MAMLKNDISQGPPPAPPVGAPQKPPPKPRQNLGWPSWWLPAADVVAAFIAFVLAYLMRYQVQLIRPVAELNQVPYTIYIPYTLVFVGWLMLQYATSGLYRVVRNRSLFEEFAIIVNGVTNAVVLIMAISFMVQAAGFSRLMLVYLALMSILLLGGIRIAQRWTYAYLRSRRGIGIQRVLIVGVGEVGQAVLRVMLARQELGYRPVGYLDDNPARGNVNLGRVRGLGGAENLEEAIMQEAVDLIVITLPWQEHQRVLHMVDICKRHGVQVRVVPDVFQLNLRQVSIENLDGIPLLWVQLEPTFYTTNRILKRLLDLMLIVVASPAWLVVSGLVALAIKFDGTDGNILYKQERVGENGKHFQMYKFRSMIPGAHRLKTELAEKEGQDLRFVKLKDDPRITPVGKFIRRTSLDELPNLINVIRGEMSLVGTRPPTPDEVELYDDWHHQRLKTVPGITGMWQISGRSEVPFDEVVLLDIYYIENWSIWLDIEILLRTIPRVLLRDGAY